MSDNEYENFEFDGDNEAETWQKGIEDEDSLHSNHASPDQSVLSRSDSESRPENGENDENYDRHENYEDSKKEKIDESTFKDQDSDAENNDGSDDELSNRRKEHFMSESDEEIETTKDQANASDLFGDADDISSDDDEEEENNANTSKSPMESHEDIEQDANNQPGTSPDGDDNASRDVTRRDHDDDEHHSGSEEEEAEPPEVRIEADLPKISVNLGDQMHFVKLPNFLSVDPRPFDEQLYEDEVDEEDLMDEEGRTRLKLKVENTIRWKYAKEQNGNPLYDELGNLKKESNARFVKWSDGSLSLHLGNEVFDVYTMGLRSDYNHLYVRQGLGLQGQAVFKTKLTFRPHSTDSFTHRKMTMSLADRSSKTQKVKVLPIVGKDPESQRSELIKKEDERLKAVTRRENQQRRMKEKVQHRGLNSNYLDADYEDDDDDNVISLSAIKKQHKNKPIYSSNSDDDSSLEGGKKRKLNKTKRKESEDESETEIGGAKKKVKISYSDDDDEE